MLGVEPGTARSRPLLAHVERPSIVATLASIRLCSSIIIESKARFRASLVRSLLPLLQERGIAAEVRERMRAETWGAIESASRSDMLPATMMIELEDAIVDARGEQALVEFWRDYTLRSASAVPIFRPLIDGLMRVFVGPRGVVRVLPRALAMTGRDLGEFSARIHGDGRGADFIYEKLDIALRTRTFALATQGSLEGGFRLVGAAAQVDFDESALSTGTLVMRVRWEDAPDSVRTD